MTPRKILNYLHKHGPTNTYKLSTNLKIDRIKLINLIEELAKEELVKFKHGTVTIIPKEKIKSKKAKPAKSVKASKKPKLKSHSEFNVTKRKILKSENRLLKKKRSLKKEIKELQTQRGSIVQKFSEERKLLNQVKREKKETEENLVEWEQSLKQREESIKKKGESISAELKRLKKKKERISKARVLKKDIDGLEATLDNLKKRINTEKRKLKRLKEKKVRPVPKRKKPKKIKPVLMPITKEHRKEIGISNIETERPKITANDILQSVSGESVKDEFHDLIEEERSLLKEKRVKEARNIHIQIKDMLDEIIDPEQRRTIIRDWNRIRDFY